MKSLLAVILAGCMILTLSACGNDNLNDNKTNSNSENNSITQTDTNTDNKQDENKIDLMYTFKDPSNPVAFDYPNFKSIEEGTSQIFKNSKYVIAYCCDSGTADLKDIPNVLVEKFNNATDIYLYAPFDSFSIEKSNMLNISDQEVLQINGYIIGKFDSGSKVKLPMQGYTFAKDGMIYELIAVLSEESNDVNQNEMEQTIEAMINTLREDR